MAGLTIPVEDAKRFQVVPTGAAPRPKFVYRDGEATSEPVLWEGRPVFVFDAAVALDGQPLGAARVESCVEELPELPFGTVLVGEGKGELRVMPRDQYTLRVTMTMVSLKVLGRPGSDK